MEVKVNASSTGNRVVSAPLSLRVVIPSAENYTACVRFLTFLNPISVPSGVYAVNDRHRNIKFSIILLPSFWDIIQALPLCGTEDTSFKI